jgi:hypothetical protein
LLFIVGIDDTDNAGSINTGALAERMGLKLEARGHTHLVSVTVHQLFHHPAISQTNDNCCACLMVEADPERRRDVELNCREFLLAESAAGSDPGFALAAWNNVSPEIIGWGHLAKKELLKRQDAINLARENGISIAGFTGTGMGVIGALAAVGLFFSGNDGRCQWLPGLPKLKGILKLGELLHLCNIDRVENLHGRLPQVNDRINLGDQARPILRDSQSLLLVQSAKKGEPYEWVTLNEEKVKQLSP